MLLTLQDISLSRGTKTLLNQANVCVFEKQKIGLVGHNGCGKSSLFDLIQSKLLPDTGQVILNPQAQISYLAQELIDTEETAIEFVLGGDTQYIQLIEQLAHAEQQGRDAEVLACHDLLQQMGGYSKKAQAATILSGLGFKPAEQALSVNQFSGGWRMRLNLARCLMKPAELLLLDEPTNHLDLEAIYWLEKWLKQTPSAVILISHDREFLDAFVTHIIHFENQSLTLYKGNFSVFEDTRAQHLVFQQAMYDKQQAKINHLMSYVERFRAKASKAKQAQSRLKAIAKMEQVAALQTQSPFSFEFFATSRVNPPLLQCSQLMAGYQSDKPILKQVNLTINPGDRIGLLGPNGEGKSTFIKTLMRALSPLQGSVHHAANLNIGYFAQHQLEQLDCTRSPIQTIQAMSPKVSEQMIRNFLGGFNFVGDMATQSIHHFSGGEKARLVLAMIVWSKPNLLLLDEPTNHLDLGMRSAIELALQSYDGALVLITHDRHLLRTTVDDLYLVYQGRVNPFKGDIDGYQQWLLEREKTKDTPKQSMDSIDYKEKKQLQNRLKSIEQKAITYRQTLLKLEQDLSDPDLYQEGKQKQLAQMQQQCAKVQHDLDVIEREWLEIAERLE